MTSRSSDQCPDVTFVCSAVDLPSTVLRWFFSNELFAQHSFIPGESYPRPTRTIINTTLNTELGGVDIEIVEASQPNSTREVTNFISTMKVNISALQKRGLTDVSCGSTEARISTNISYDDNAGWFTLMCLATNVHCSLFPCSSNNSN